MSGDDVQFSKARIEMLCDAIFAIGFVILLQPFSVALSLVLSVVAPGQAMAVLAISEAAIAGTGRRRGHRVAPA
jgi:hypothetical protein